jgi:hypothetical protein
MKPKKIGAKGDDCQFCLRRWQHRPLRHDALEPELGCMAKNNLAVVVLQVLIQPQTRTCLGQHGGERGLANLERVPAQVVAIQLDQVEWIEEHTLSSYRR